MIAREIFRGRHYRAVHCHVSNDPLVVVNFEFWWPTPSIEDQPSAEAFFAARGINFVGIRGAHNDWFLDDEILDVVAAVRRATEGCRRVGYGGSMGGFAVINFAHDLHLDSLVAVCPQFSIDRAKAPFECRWAEEAATIAFRHDKIALIPPIQDGYLIYDPASIDAAHAVLIREYHPLVAVPIPFTGHDILRALGQADVLEELLIGLIAGGFDRPTFVRRLRAGRSRSGVCWLCAAEARLRLGHLRAALRAILAAKDLTVPDPVRADVTHATILRRLGRDVEADAIIPAPVLHASAAEGESSSSRLEARIGALEAELAMLRASTSWRLTKPLRLLGRLLRR